MYRIYYRGHIIEEMVCQVGYLPELYEDAPSEKYLKKLCNALLHLLLVCIRSYLKSFMR